MIIRVDYKSNNPLDRKLSWEVIYTFLSNISFINWSSGSDHRIQEQIRFIIFNSSMTVLISRNTIVDGVGHDFYTILGPSHTFSTIHVFLSRDDINIPSPEIQGWLDVFRIMHS